MPTRFLSILAILCALTTAPLAGEREAIAAYQSGDFATALSELRPLADSGNATAQTILAFMHANGQGVPLDAAQAAKWFERAALQGNADAQHNLGYLYEVGQGVPQDLAVATKWYRLAAEQGRADSQFNLGAISEDAQDFVDAEKWYRLAANQGDAYAQVNLGLLFANGKGVSPNYAEAGKWFTSAARQNYAPGQFNLGTMYLEGHGVAVNETEALRWFRLAAEQDHAPAQFTIGIAYHTGRGVPPDDTEAAKWFGLAAAQGHAPAQSNLGTLYDQGQGVEQSDEDAVRWYTAAAEQGEVFAQNGLGLMYRNGYGVDQSDVEAYKWLHLAAQQGHAAAAEDLAEITARMSPEDIAKGKSPLGRMETPLTRVFLATLGTETNTFASFPTSLDDFRRGFWVENGIANSTPNPWAGPAQQWLKRATAAGWEVLESLHAFAEPAGPTIRSAYETMRDRILDDLKTAGPVDAVLMFLHGAMIAEGYDDCEADFVTRMRAQVGPGVKIGLELDLHAHIDTTLVDAADIIVFYKAYPHIDYTERADDLFNLMEKTLAGEIKPVMALFDCRVMGLFPTTREGPMVGLVADMLAAEGKNGILSLSLNHGFPWADVPNAGAKMLVVADGDRALAARAAEQWGRRFYDSRAEATLPFVPFAEAIAAAKKPGDKPLLLADTSDQTGGGAPGDTTYMIKALLDAGITNAVYGPLWDVLAVGICFAVGVGAKLKLKIGGKFEPHSGPSIDVDAEVLFLKRDAYQDQLTSERVPMGDVAVIRVAGLEILLNTRRVGVFSPTMFTHHGITLADKSVIGLKNLYKHRDVFAPLVRDQMFVATPGACPPDWKSIPFTRIPRPMWPLDDDPLGNR